MSRNNSSQRNRAHPSIRSPTRQAVWSRLDRVHSHSRSPGHASRSDYHRPSMQYNGRDRNRDAHSRARGVTEWTVPRTGSLNERRQQEWRPREHQAIKNTPKDNGDDRVNVPSDGLRNVRMMGDNRSGRLVIHRNETDEEKRKRLKGKAIMTSNADTLMSKAKDAASSEVNDHTNYGHEVGVAEIQKILPSLGTIEVGEDGLMNEENAKLVTMTAEDEAEVDKLVYEFDDVMMDENMMENDDLLVDEPGYDAEQIDAISQLYPMQIQEEGARDGSDNDQNQLVGKAQQDPQKGDGSRADPTQNRVDHPPGTQSSAKGLLKRKSTPTIEVKGARASRKLQAHRRRSSPKKTKGSVAQQALKGTTTKKRPHNNDQEERGRLHIPRCQVDAS
ncbi:hypothetical protein F2Q69_00046780 [Brassica cretica]|uniref:Uncharacterized protein n=1 Tax=Brassica cretica TaxID=69181 RepID=A0A8S9PSJ7_BRACR|nr:hypothetical protein F2Q69_00046780 [Brassica cretica]